MPVLFFDFWKFDMTVRDDYIDNVFKWAMSTGMTDGMEMSYQALDGVLAGG